MTHAPSSNRSEYWEHYVPRWEESAYGQEAVRPGGARLFDRLVARLASRVISEAARRRQETALRLLQPYLPGSRVLDVGCAGGRFAFRLLQAGVDHVTGVDIADSAVALAEQARQACPEPDRLTFFRADLAQPGASLPMVDLVTAFGVLDYFGPAQLPHFFGSLRTRYFFCDFLLDNGWKWLSLQWLPRKLYLRLDHFPGEIHFYRLPEITRVAEAAGFTGVHLMAVDGHNFLTNVGKAGE